MLIERRWFPLVLVLLSAAAFDMEAQAVRPPLPSWRPVFEQSPVGSLNTRPPEMAARPTHGHTLTGLLVGGLVGAAATGVFLAGFCSGSDNQCGADEVGRATLIIALPVAAAGALIGTLIRTPDTP